VVQKVHELENRAYPLLDLVLGNLAQFEREGDVLENGHVRPERVVLEHHRARTFLGAEASHVATGYDDRPAVRCEESRDHAKSRRLATAGWPEQRDKLALVHREVEIVDDRAPPEHLIQTGNLQTETRVGATASNFRFSWCRAF